MVFTAVGLAVAAPAVAQVTFYEGEDFHGQAFTTNQAIADFDRDGFNGHVSSAVVDSGFWQLCEHAHFQGRCVVLRPGSYPSLAEAQLDRRIASVQPVTWDARYENEAPAPLAAPTYTYRQRPNEALYQAQVTSVHAVMGPPDQRCWVEREQVPGSSAPNIGGAIIGGIIGGVLGHQIGAGVGRDVATAGGAVAGAAVGANVNRPPAEQDGQRCRTLPSQAPAFWDVAYNFDGVEHHVQMTAPPPGPTITVNGAGEPRG